MAIRSTLTSRDLEIQFFGKAAHAAANPEEGVNALDAMLLSFSAIASLRQHIKDKARIHGIITSGGEAANIVPAYTAATFKVRAEDNAYGDELEQRVLNCFIGAATATGARLEYKWVGPGRAALRYNVTLTKLFIRNMQSLGREISLYAPSSSGLVSTDMGNVSQIVPSIHPFFAIASTRVHTPEFASASASEVGIRGMLDAAKALAMTVIDLAANPKIVGEIKREFEHSENRR